MSQIGVFALLSASIAIGLIVVWQVARKFRAIYAVSAGVFVTVVPYALIIWQSSLSVAETVKAGCFEWCGTMEYLTYGGTGIIAVLTVLIGGSRVAYLVRKRARINDVPEGS